MTCERTGRTGKTGRTVDRFNRSWNREKSRKMRLPGVKLELSHLERLVEAVLEGDSELILTVLKAGGQTLASVEPLIMDALVLSKLYIKLLSSRSRRDGNKLDYSLARHSINVLDYAV
ncbi:hypothetical protein SO802_034534 [Lithocarpus litseifolius]|uniref:Uncharacterized protein n=1 Tax=Lithocarpus litseifolius TaxID=425828 RepID=A0AAW2BJJ3_9ROSI